jgi:DNA-directed RNA polymerase subunit L
MKLLMTLVFLAGAFGANAETISVDAAQWATDFELTIEAPQKESQYNNELLFEITSTEKVKCAYNVDNPLFQRVIIAKKTEQELQLLVDQSRDITYKRPFAKAIDGYAQPPRAGARFFCPPEYQDKEIIKSVRVLLSRFDFENNRKVSIVIPANTFKSSEENQPNVEINWGSIPLYMGR